MKRILLIEDTPELQHLYQFGLEREGFTVEAVGSAGEGLTRVGSGQAYDVILLDLMLMGMSGLDFLKQSHIHEVSPKTKIIVLTNVDNPEVIERVKAHGIDDYLLKAQTEPKALAEIIRNLLTAPTIKHLPTDPATGQSNPQPNQPA